MFYFTGMTTCELLSLTNHAENNLFLSSLIWMCKLSLSLLIYELSMAFSVYYNVFLSRCTNSDIFPRDKPNGRSSSNCSWRFKALWEVDIDSLCLNIIYLCTSPVLAKKIDLNITPLMVVTESSLYHICLNSLSSVNCPSYNLCFIWYK